MRTFTITVLCLIGWATPAAADNTHFEMSFAFLGGQRSYEAATFSYTEGTASPSLGGSFQAAPFSGVPVAGPMGEACLVVHGVRFSVGMQSPYANLNAEQQSAPLAGAPMVEVHGLDIREFRYGLGYEMDFARYAVFADLIGTADRVSAKLTVGDEHSTYESKNFGYSARLGGRYAITRNYYAHASIEFGMGGNVDGSAYGGVGVRIP